MLTNPCDAFTGQLTSSNIVLFHMVGIVSSCAAVTLFMKRAVFPDIQLQKYRDLEIRVRGHSRSLKVVPFNMIGYDFLLVFYRNYVPKTSTML